MCELNLLYRTVAGCSSILENLLLQGGCGPLVAEASVFARARGQGIGFIVVTEIAPRQGHLAQVVVLPAYQRQGVGRRLVQHCLSPTGSTPLRHAVVDRQSCRISTLSDFTRRWACRKSWHSPCLSGSSHKVAIDSEKRAYYPPSN